MYISEWIMWLANLKSDEWVKKNIDEYKGPGRPVIGALYEETVAEENAFQAAKRFHRAETRGPIYAFNNTYLEMRCGGLEDKRGLVTLISCLALYGVIGMWASIGGRILLAAIFDSEVILGRALSIGDYLVFLVGTTMTVTMLWYYSKYALWITRMEMLTSRHLLIRFNRVTRQVYLHRPKSCGGIMVLPWEGIASMEVAGQRLMVGWFPGEVDLPFPTFAFIGKQSSSQAELQAEWEFIRRYMDEGGLQAVAKPRTSSLLPLPWNAFSPQFEALGAFARNGGPLIWLGALLISPAFVIIGLSHWASLLLCWRPRWPKIIREAGKPGKPTPAFTTVADYPPDVQEKLLANAHRWELRPGRAPDHEHWRRKRNGA
ncbi:MAG: hypothetical protein LBE51_19595 [Acidovorax sp.]|jgi:hypothetical protein|nr:hypothetical protein [Acidovorax sp.]